ncbi:hypothetical protein [Spirosoma luteum]|uniref:hypothetical protein n=1 Tax=Spirosoma luteum TaxID=431553 RepID=UPI0004762EF2|nr:hypothetical protein [Spirosoma luteum]
MARISSRHFLSWIYLLAAAATLTVPQLHAQPRIRPTSPTLAAPVVKSLRQAADGLQTIENDQIRVGVNTNAGGAITYLAFVNNQGGNVNTRNMVSNPDLGRQIQIGLYSGPINYSDATGWTNLGWDPIQAGDAFGYPSKVIAFERGDNLLYVKTIPNQWGVPNEPGEATIEHWVRLEGNVVKVHAKVVMFRSDKTQYVARQQELPCVYLTGDYHNMWYYSHGSPYTNGDLTLSRIQPPATAMFGDVFPTEPWMATTNANGYGVGLYVPNNFSWKRGYFGSDLSGDEHSFEASYIAATNYVVLDHNLVYEWDYELIMGNLNTIRSYVYNKPRSASGPNYVFDNSRHGWFYESATDTGFPLSGKLHVNLTDASRSHISSPFVFWKGRDNPKIYLRAAFKTLSDTFRMKWRLSDETTTYGDKFIDFPIINDGQFHTYVIDVSNQQNWLNSNIGQLMFETTATANGNDLWAEFASISTNTDTPAPTPQPPVVTIPCDPSCSIFTVQKLQYNRPKR